ncbi:Rieske 2Fe-2S domain-containing protein [Streptomyces cavernicola]|uniref:Rieske 2Fe-2S domain-containing protein n=1 Tax=Streptomyces cavernicola TaxID=3043613 RepID=A0ABT6S566_9ACTN|nr:Rieske 2Fe-2S domain-containing protein [Streptomyces sp. B-S-A6]MDI3403235.1 Rieske 2Fe-2S domain-containing protein [Streptomyces sp. B-S-A6]
MSAEELLLRAENAWHPVASESDLVHRHVFHGQLLGQELALWRADDEHINVWENRCLHRGVRLSIAVNDGRELKCQYHGWRYANRTAACTYIPAHPADAPARTIRNGTYPVRTSGGMVWTAVGQPTGEPPALGQGLVLRPVPVRARPADVITLLLEQPPALPDAQPPTAKRRGDLVVELESVGFLVVQPMDSDRAVIRGVLSSQGPAGERLRILRHFDAALTRLRDTAQDRAADEAAPAPLLPRYEPVPKHLASLPESSGHHDLPTRVRVVRTWSAGAGVRGLELGPVDDRPLPTGQAGAHLDVALPGGLVRQYSLVNGPGETHHYVIGVKLTPGSAGGSAAVHERVREGDVLAVSLPRNGFPLRRDRTRTLLIAGGIGITPLLAMAQTLEHQRLSYALHYFAAGEADVAFRERLAALGSVRTVTGLDPAATEAELERLLGAAGEDSQVYFCGPPPMLDVARDVAGRTGWPRDSVHFEYFRNDRTLDHSSRFEVVLARSVLNLTVEPGRSILETVRAAGVGVPSSCEQGACGTCRVAVIDGRPDHQDVYLDDEERAAGDSVMTCVSRSLTPRLTLDL